MVSVCMITYNHESFIVQAIDGVLMQKTNFSIELIIGEDCSTDCTRKVVVDYAEKYPEVIKLQLPNENKGMIRNFVETMQAATGKYIALCEGDDYWTDPLKLQKQVDFLEENEEYGLVCGRGGVFNVEKDQFVESNGTKDVEKYESIILAFNDVVTATSLIRKDLLLKCVDECSDLREKNLFIDTAIWYWFAYNSKIKFMDEEFSVYRVLEESASHTKDLDKRLSMDLNFMYLKMYFLLKYPPKDKEQLPTILDTITNEYKIIVDLAQHISDDKVRKTKPYRIGSKLKSFVNLFIKK